jgi:hypothetical protein
MKNTSKRNRTVRRQQARENPAADAPAAPSKVEGSGDMTAFARAIVWGSALVSMLPLLLCWRQFSELFYFHDDFLLLDERARSTLLQWIFHPFENESIFPLFKSLWMSAVWGFGGSYLWLIVLQWATHFAICLVFGALLIRMRMPAIGAGFAVVTFGLASSNLETLAWSIQWGSQLSLLFFLLAWYALARILEGHAGAVWYVWYVFCVLASTLCSSRGVVCGMLLGLFTLLAGKGERIKLCAASVVPTVLLVLITWLWVPASRPSQVGAFHYGLNYLALNPLFSLIPTSGSATSVGLVIVFGTIKAAVIALAFYQASRRLHPFLIALVVFDVATAAALGYARTWTGLATTVSSRYQYIPLLCFGPMLGVVISGWRKELAAIAVVLWIWLLSYRWGISLEHWVFLRGTRIRHMLASYPPNAVFDPSKLTAARARELIEQFHLN